MLEPLLELGNVRRMSDEELRTAAQTILERRGVKLSAKPEIPGKEIIPTELVPMPVE
jgi:hypothetical protein